MKWNRRIEEKIFGISLGSKLILASQEHKRGERSSALNCNIANDAEDEKAGKGLLFMNVVQDKQIHSNVFEAPGKDFISFDAEKVLSNDHMGYDESGDNATEDHEQECIAMNDDDLNASFKESLSEEASVAMEEIHDRETNAQSITEESVEILDIIHGSPGKETDD